MRPFLLAILLLIPQTGSDTFDVVVSGSKIGTEEFSIRRRADGFLATGHTRLRVDGETLDAESRMELDADLNPLSYEYKSGDREIRVEIGAEVSEVMITVGEEVTSLDIRFPAGGMIVDDNFFHHYLLLLDRVGAQGGRVPVLVPQQLTVGTVRVEPVGDLTYDLITENLRLRASTDEEGQLQRLVGLDSDVVVER